MSDLPPLECLRFFEAAGRRESFTKAAEELRVTSAAVARRIKILERHLEGALFERRRHGVRLNTRGRGLLRDVQQILAEVHNAAERYRSKPRQRRFRIFSITTVAYRWLVPRLGRFTATYPNVAITLETSHHCVDLRRPDFDALIAYEVQPKESERDATSVHGVLVETLFEELIVPVCSPSLLEAQGQPHRPSDLHGWPLLYDIFRDAGWQFWFDQQGESPLSMSTATGFRDYGMLVDACIQGRGVALGRTRVLASELESRTLVPIFNMRHAVPSRCLLITTPESRHRSEVQSFRDWVLAEARSEPGLPFLTASTEG